VAHIFSSGFGEVGERGLEEEVLRAAEGRVRIIGPNCMGVYCPSSFLRFAYHQPPEPGEVGFISQSGGQAVNFIYAGVVRGFRFSKVISYGNGGGPGRGGLPPLPGGGPADQGGGDVPGGSQEGEGEGAEEGDGGGEREKARGGAQGGKDGGGGGRAASSHTGSLAGAGEVWSGFLEQAGALEVESFTEMADLLAALLRSPLPRGKGVVVTTVSGGTSVVETDALVEEGLEVPALEWPGGPGKAEEGGDQPQQPPGHLARLRQGASWTRSCWPWPPIPPCTP